LCDLEPTEGQSRLDILKPNYPLEGGTRTCAGQMQINDRSTIGEISPEQKRIFCFYNDVELPITDWRLGYGKIRSI